MLNTNYFYNKYYEDLTIDQLLWLTKNSHINYWIFNSQILNTKTFSNMNSLKKYFPEQVNKIEKTFNMFLNTNDLFIGQNVYYSVLELYREISRDPLILLNSLDNIEDLLKLYPMLVNIKNTAFKDFHEHIYSYLKNKKHDYGIKPIEYLENSWRIWPEFCIREEKKFDFNTNDHKTIIEHMMTLCEHNKYEEALEFSNNFKYSIEEVYKNPVAYSFIYYKLKILKHLNKIDEFKFLYDEYNMDMGYVSFKNCISLFKSIFLDFMKYEIGMINKQETVNISKYKFELVFKRLFKKDALSFIFINKYKMLNYRDEHVIEVLTCLKSYHDLLVYDKPLYNIN